MNFLDKKNCVPCRGGIPPLTKDEIKVYLSEVNHWEVVDSHHLKKVFEFPDFKSTLFLVNKISDLAELENHHPNICFTWGRVEITIWTHKINGLHENDFILASKIDSLL